MDRRGTLEGWINAERVYDVDLSVGRDDVADSAVPTHDGLSRNWQLRT